MDRKGTLHYYACAHKLTHKCQARAIVKKVVEVDEVDEVEGSEAVHFTLLYLPYQSLLKYSTLEADQFKSFVQTRHGILFTSNRTADFK